MIIIIKKQKHNKHNNTTNTTTGPSPNPSPKGRGVECVIPLLVRKCLSAIHKQTITCTLLLCTRES